MVAVKDGICAFELPWGQKVNWGCETGASQKEWILSFSSLLSPKYIWVVLLPFQSTHPTVLSLSQVCYWGTKSSQATYRFQEQTLRWMTWHDCMAVLRILEGEWSTLSAERPSFHKQSPLRPLHSWSSWERESVVRGNDVRHGGGDHSGEQRLPNWEPDSGKFINSSPKHTLKWCLTSGPSCPGCHCSSVKEQPFCAASRNLVFSDICKWFFKNCFSTSVCSNYQRNDFKTLWEKRKNKHEEMQCGESTTRQPRHLPLWCPASPGELPASRVTLSPEGGAAGWLSQSRADSALHLSADSPQLPHTLHQHPGCQKGQGLWS